MISDTHERLEASAKLSELYSKGLPEGWAIIVRQWGKRSFDALIVPPLPEIGWRLADPFAKTARGARKRAKEEILDHLRRRARLDTVGVSQLD